MWVLIVKGSVNFSGAVTLNGDAELDTDSSSDQLNLFGGVQVRHVGEDEDDREDGQPFDGGHRATRSHRTR